MKTSVSRRLLSFTLILCMITPMLPVIEFTASSASTPTYIASIGITQKGSADAAKSALSGHTIIDRDLNEGAEGDYVYMGYKTTNDPYGAITGIVFQVGKNPPESISYGGCTFNLVGGSEETNTSSQGGWIDLNGAAGGDYIYTYVTRDHNYGAPLTTMTVDEGSSKSGYSTGTDTSGSVIDLNQKAGGKYLYLHYKRYSATVTINFYHLNDAGKVVVTQVSGTVKHHLEEMKGKPSVPGLVTYDEKPLRRICWREDPSIENQGTSLVSSPSATVATSGKNYYATYGFLTDTLAIYPDTIIRFDANGGISTSYVMSTVGTRLYSLPSASFGDYEFLGWWTEKTGGIRVDIGTTFEEDCTLFAHWSILQHTIDVDADGGMEEFMTCYDIDTQTVTSFMDCSPYRLIEEDVPESGSDYNVMIIVLIAIVTIMAACGIALKVKK
jgi:hypothetical protein